MDELQQPKHFTREPWWVVPIGGIAAGLLPLIKYGRFKQANLGVGLAEAMITAGLLGSAAAALLVARSHIRSVGWSNLVLWLGILVIALGACFLLVTLAP